MRSAAAEAGKSVAVYCWSQNAEKRALESGAQLAADKLGRENDPADVEEFTSSDEFIDLLEVFNAQVETGSSSGLKRIAPMAGFEWRDDDPGGEASMLWHADALAANDPTARQDLQRRLLAYNEDDVRATAAVREWLTTARLSSVTAISPSP